MNPMSSSERLPLGQFLLERGLINAADLERALASQQMAGLRLGRLLVRLGAISEDNLLPALAEHLGLSLLGEAELQAESANILRTVEMLGIPRPWFAERGLVVFEAADGALHCAARYPQDSFLQEVMSAQAQGHQLVWHLMRSRDEEWLAKLLAPQSDDGIGGDETAHLRELAEEAPVIELVNTVFAQAADENASDIHIEPEEHEFFVRLRVDGVLQTRATLPSERFAAVASRIKLIAGLDIAERRLPQDGRITLRVSGVDLDVRVSVVPGVHGESVVMRLLPKNQAEFRLDRLGLEPDHLKLFLRWAREPNGIILVTGPTGSGKSTTLYAVLSEVNDRQSKIITVEDPVEYRMRGVTQIQTQAEIGYTFGRALRAILRQDPDIIMIGEIRDLETAEIAVQSALTGHTVFSTLHTNDALSAFTRLVDMGVEPFLVASSVRAVQAQRLVRRLCPHCAKPAEMPGGIAPLLDDLRERAPGLFENAPNWRVAGGCEHCQHTGYRGRLGIYEMVDVSPDIQTAIMQRQPAHHLAALARAQGYRTLREDGLVKAWQGLTSVEEVLRVTGTSDAVAEEA
ncbi:MAG: type II secretion system protein [Roseateles depolymerans]|uniref:Type II secretion system protein n=1 Tax=Roseateles depolymerans TaxID=76731 RepID=A0A2W5D650_9BURK|nr:MAG: type II secretion system protein [Roseateles depolymerans]